MAQVKDLSGNSPINFGTDTSIRDLQTTPSRRLVPVTLADSDLPEGTCRGLMVDTAGTLNLMDAEGNIRAAVKVQKGFNPIAVRQCRTGGTAQDIWAVY